MRDVVYGYGNLSNIFLLYKLYCKHIAKSQLVTK